MAEKEASKEKDVGQIVRYLTSSLNSVSCKLPRPFRSNQGDGKGIANKAYKWETEFAYRVNEVIQGPRCLLQSNITKCNDFIARCTEELNKQEDKQ